MISDFKKSSTFTIGLIWFGAAVSIAEILTGTCFAPLGFTKGILAIIIGHLIGCTLFFSAGLIGGREGKSAMECVKMSFGGKGSLLFSVLNVLQLVGWTAVMIYSGASAAGSVLNLGGLWPWSLIISALIAVWLALDVRNMNRMSTMAMSALFALTIVMSYVIFNVINKTSFTSCVPSAGDALSFGAAVELAAAMPLSWLPLVSDYTRNAEKPFTATLVSSIVYFIVSSWMYFIGMGAAICVGDGDIVSIMLKSGLGVSALAIVLFSTVTTTCLDAYSAGVSSVSISAKIREKPASLIVCALGAVLAIFTPVSKFESFLYLIGSVFAPMVAIQIADYFFNRKKVADRPFDWLNLALWLMGFLTYRYFMRLDFVVGCTLPAMLVTAAFCVAAHKIGGKNVGR